MIKKMINDAYLVECAHWRNSYDDSWNVGGVWCVHSRILTFRIKRERKSQITHHSQKIDMTDLFLQTVITFITRI